MAETLIAFFGMLILVLLFVGFVQIYGGRVERREARRHDPPAPQVQPHPRVTSRPLRSDGPAPSGLRASLAPMVRTAIEAAHRVRTPSAEGAAGANVQDAPADDLPHSPEELYQLTQAILHKQRGASKAEAIQRAFGVSKGGNPKYQRLSRMFDLATEPPDRYTPLDSDQRPAVLSKN